MRRRALLAAATGSAVPAGLVRPARAVSGRPEAPSPAARRLELRHAWSGKRFSGAYHDGSSHDPAALAELSAFLADRRTGAVHPVDPRVIDILWDVGRRAGVRGEFVVFSGYRTPETNAAVCGAGNSQHLRGRALDVCAASRGVADLAAAALALGRGGVGVYARQGFIHLDSGPVRRWGDVPPGGVPPGGVPPGGLPPGGVLAGGAGPARPAAPDPLARIAEAWAATRRR